RQRRLPVSRPRARQEGPRPCRYTDRGRSQYTAGPTDPDDRARPDRRRGRVADDHPAPAGRRRERCSASCEARQAGPAAARAEAGAALAHAAFVPVDVSTAQIDPLNRRFGVIQDPAVLVLRAPGDLIVRIDGFADRDTVAQAAANAATAAPSTATPTPTPTPT